MMKSKVDERECPFCQKRCEKSTKWDSRCSTTVTKLIETYPDAFLTVYDGKKKNDNDYCHSKCANLLKNWGTPTTSTQVPLESSKSPLNQGDSTPGAKNPPSTSTNQKASPVIGGLEKSLDGLTDRVKRLFDEITACFCPDHY